MVYGLAEGIIMRSCLLGLGMIVGLSSGCGRIQQLEQAMSLLRNEMAELRSQHELDMDRHHYRMLSGERRIWGHLECKNHEVADFVSSCQKEGELSCGADSLASAMAFMGSQPYATMYFRPKDMPSDMLTLRKGQLAMLTDPQLLHPSTKFLIIALPRSDAPEHINEANRIGHMIQKLLRQEHKVPDWVPVLGPRALPCKLKQEQIKDYVRRWDVPQHTEPKPSEPRIRLWVFRTDC